MFTFFIFDDIITNFLLFAVSNTIPWHTFVKKKTATLSWNQYKTHKGKHFGTNRSTTIPTIPFDYSF